MNWVIVAALGLFLAEILHRIPQEEAILVELFGEEYIEYRRRVGALGPMWFCACFNRPWRRRDGDASSSLLSAASQQQQQQQQQRAQEDEGQRQRTTARGGEGEGGYGALAEG